MFCRHARLMLSEQRLQGAKVFAAIFVSLRARIVGEKTTGRLQQSCQVETRNLQVQIYMKYFHPLKVDHIIEEATSKDNLCLMYEGWTPWV